MAQLIAIIFVVLCVISESFGWGKQGHMMIAQIASDRLTDTASNIVNQFVGVDYTLATIAPLPDDYDHDPSGRWSAPCHYCNLPRDATSFLMTYCPNFCVVKSIGNYTKILSSEESDPFQCDYTDGVEPCALEFLVHFVGDVHQPLHVGYGYDEGGNKVDVDFYDSRTNLHKVWDTLMIDRWNSDFESATQELETMIQNNPDQVQRYLSNMDPISWGNESFGYVLSTVYNFQTSKGAIPHLGDAYYNANLPIVKQRLIAAGVRLGQLLNNICVGLAKPFFG